MEYQIKLSLSVITTEHAKEAAATSHKGPVIWCILIDLLLSKRVSLESAHFKKGYGERFFPP
jgi:hypothetical protein